MRLHVVNPNTTASMTAKIAAAARRAAAVGVEILATNPERGPASIEGFYDGALAVPGMLARIGEAEVAGVNAHIIACFDDTGLDAARCLARAPVVGIGEAAAHLATLVAGKFTVVTMMDRSIPVLEGNLARYGFAGRCARVRALGVPVLALEEPGSTARARLSDEIAAALRQDQADAIVLGCAGMADLAAALQEKHGIPVIEGVAAAVQLAGSLVALGLTTSKVGGWAAPVAKASVGDTVRGADLRAAGS